MTPTHLNGHPRQTVFVTDMAAVSAIGDNLATTWRALVSERSGIAPVKRFSTRAYTSSVAACIPGLNMPPLRSAIGQLSDMLIAQLSAIPPDAVLITATTKAGIDVLARAESADPDIANILLPSVLADQIGARLQLNGARFNVSAACASSTVAIGRAAAMIAAGRVESALVIGLDLVTEFVFSGFSALKALSATGCRPFDRLRDGLTLGEGGAALLLMSDTRADAEQRPKLARVSGWGAANDAIHMTAPARDGRGLVQAIEAALQMSELNPDDIDAVNAHGTGTVYNDMMELVAFEKVFGPRTLPLYSVKGAVGHTLGAAGALEAALGITALQNKILPPTVRLLKPETSVPNGAQLNAIPFQGERLLSTNSGFGGINAALILEKVSN